MATKIIGKYILLTFAHATDRRRFTDKVVEVED